MGLRFWGAGGRDLGEFEIMSSALECDCDGGIEAFVEAEDEEFTLAKAPARRGGGGGGAFEFVVGGDCETVPDLAVISSDVDVDFSRFAKGFCLS